MIRTGTTLQKESVKMPLGICILVNIETGKSWDTFSHEKCVVYMYPPIGICIKPRSDKRRVYLIVATRTQSNMEEWIVYSMT
jgi:hypothetical protein